MKIYVVINGYYEGFFLKWEEVKRLVNGYADAEYKSLKTQKMELNIGKNINQS